MQKSKKSIGRKFLLAITITVFVIALLACAAVAFCWFYAEKNIDYDADERLFITFSSPTLTVYYCDGMPDDADYTPIAYFDESDTDTRVSYTVTEMGENLRNAFLAAEDRDFYNHSGFSPIRTARAAVNSLLHFEPTFGASTITQQVVKNISGDSEPTVKRKFTEILRAVGMEKRHTKDEILALYLNIIPMGENTVGCAQAAKLYFGKEPSELTVAEAATLCAIANAPTRYNPYRHPEACVEKRNKVLYAMLDFGVIGETAYAEAKAAPLTLVDETERCEPTSDWFVETARKQILSDLKERYGYSDAAAMRTLTYGGLSVYLTVDSRVQSAMEKEFEDSEKLSDGVEYAMTVIDNRTGNFVGIIGAKGKKTANRLLNHATAKHTPGSVLKPLALYAPLIDEGKITWSTVFDDVPTSFENGTAYPANLPRRYDGLTTVKDALRLSKNTVAVSLYKMRGANAIYHGLTEDFEIGGLVRQEIGKNGELLTDLSPAPLALGQLTCGASLFDLCRAYAAFPGDGILPGGKTYEAVYDSENREILSNRKSEKRVLGKEASRVMCKLLETVVENGTAKSLMLKEQLAFAGKTGTSGEDRDRWFVGFSPYYTAGIWCGATGNNASLGSLLPNHLEIYDETVLSIHRTTGTLKETPFSTEGLTRASFCRDSGELYSPTCTEDPRGSRLETGWFLRGTEPQTLCTRHVAVLYDTLTEKVADEGCPAEDCTEIALLRLPERDFPIPIEVIDAEYGYLELPDDVAPSEEPDEPYYANLIEEGHEIGFAERKRRFNAYCYLHSGK